MRDLLAIKASSGPRQRASASTAVAPAQSAATSAADQGNPVEAAERLMAELLGRAGGPRRTSSMGVESEGSGSGVEEATRRGGGETDDLGETHPTPEVAALMRELITGRRCVDTRALETAELVERARCVFSPA